MKRINVYVTDEQVEKIEVAHRAEKCPMAEIIRRCLDIGLRQYTQEKENQIGLFSDRWDLEARIGKIETWIAGSIGMLDPTGMDPPIGEKLAEIHESLATVFKPTGESEE